MYSSNWQHLRKRSVKEDQQRWWHGFWKRIVLCFIPKALNSEGSNTCFAHKKFSGVALFCLHSEMGLGGVDVPSLFCEALPLGWPALAPSGDSGTEQTVKGNVSWLLFSKFDISSHQVFHNIEASLSTELLIQQPCDNSGRGKRKGQLSLRNRGPGRQDLALTSF